MSFTHAERRLLALSDQADQLSPINPKGGRPRKPIENHTQAVRRACWRRYTDKIHGRLNALGELRKKGGRPRSAPDTPRQEKARIRALRRYYEKKSAIRP